jgi:hypothetical protein
MNYEQKYLKYKTKYLNLKSLMGGDMPKEQIDRIMTHFDNIRDLCTTHNILKDYFIIYDTVTKSGKLFCIALKTITNYEIEYALNQDSANKYKSLIWTIKTCPENGGEIKYIRFVYYQNNKKAKQYGTIPDSIKNFLRYFFQITDHEGEYEGVILEGEKFIKKLILDRSYDDLTKPSTKLSDPEIKTYIDGITGYLIKKEKWEKNCIKLV